MRCVYSAMLLLIASLMLIPGIFNRTLTLDDFEIFPMYEEGKGEMTVATAESMLPPSIDDLYRSCFDVDPRETHLRGRFTYWDHVFLVEPVKGKKFDSKSFLFHRNVIGFMKIHRTYYSYPDNLENRWRVYEIFDVCLKPDFRGKGLFKPFFNQSMKMFLEHDRTSGLIDVSAAKNPTILALTISMESSMCAHALEVYADLGFTRHFNEVHLQYKPRLDPRFLEDANPNRMPLSKVRAQFDKLYSRNRQDMPKFFSMFKYANDPVSPISYAEIGRKLKEIYDEKNGKIPLKKIHSHTDDDDENSTKGSRSTLYSDGSDDHDVGTSFWDHDDDDDWDNSEL